jgi:hypothetical protein
MLEQFKNNLLILESAIGNHVAIVDEAFLFSGNRRPLHGGCRS